ncbi:hypothetical protein XELAEV_18039495mg [Xenopus laevis]|uniref:Uncharacterized protein n=1 Tax=Xenopus laevis TaxID=8355 RepID=A0A974C7X9_XENLA|nr:hypothetical protein XELAEV_18039495mg [Xenopus laevis]
MNSNGYRQTIALKSKNRSWHSSIYICKRVSLTLVNVLHGLASPPQIFATCCSTAHTASNKMGAIISLYSSQCICLCFRSQSTNLKSVSMNVTQ